MPNYRYYQVWLSAQNGDAALRRLLSFLGRRLAELDIAAPVLEGGVGLMSEEGDEFFVAPDSVFDQLAARSAGVWLFVPGLEDGFALRTDVERRTIRFSLEGSPSEDDRALEDIAGELFRALCRDEAAIFGYCEDAWSVEYLWSHVFGVKDGNDLLAVGRREHAEIQAGRLPPALPWMTFFSSAHFRQAEGQLRGLPPRQREALGSGTLLRLSSRPWDALFLVKREGEETYAVMDASGEPRTLERIP